MPINRLNGNMKYIILFLLATLANADIYIQRVTSNELDQGYMFRFVQDGVVYCWGMPQMLDQAFIPPTWTPVAQAAIDYRWPTMTGNAAAACLAGPKIYRTSFTQVYGLDNNGQLIVTGTVPLGTPCGERMSDITFLRTVTYGGRFGFGICT